MVIGSSESVNWLKLNVGAANIDDIKNGYGAVEKAETSIAKCPF